MLNYAKATASLANAEVFVIDCVASACSDAPVMLYSPLAGKAAMIEKSLVPILAESLNPAEASQKASLLSEFLAFRLSSAAEMAGSQPERLLEADILVNNTCNFSCAYCYSAQGRSSAVLSNRQLKSILDYVITEERINGGVLNIGFSGGGEPLMTWPEVRYGLEYACERGTRKNAQLRLGLVTNGSLLTTAVIEQLKQFPLGLVISFEVLENVQNAQRSHYHEVCKTLDTLCESGVFPAIRSTITPANVGCLEQMVDFLAGRFPGVRGLALEPVLHRGSFPTVQSLRCFYDSFVQGFFRAKALGKSCGLPVASTAQLCVDSVKLRPCPGKLSFTPDGNISFCSRVSSPKDSLYADFIFGRLDENGKVFIDEERYRKLQNYSFFTHAQCKECFAKWHCGGGCMLRNMTYPTDYNDVACEFMRNMVKTTLERRMEHVL